MSPEPESQPSRSAELWLGIGCNVSPQSYHWQRIKTALAAQSFLHNLSYSGIVQNPAIGPNVSGQFWNAVLHAEVTLPPFECLKKLKWLERGLGRRGRGNRPADFDILYWREDKRWRRLYAKGLIIPHPGAGTRDFVLAPMSSLPDALLPAPAERAVAAWRRRAISPCQRLKQ